MPTVDPKFLSQLRYRCIGPTRERRVLAVATIRTQLAQLDIGIIGT